MKQISKDDLPLAYSEMGGFPIDHSDRPIRLFKSGFLEFFTHISPLAVVLIWLPVIVGLFVVTIGNNHSTLFPVVLPAGILVGLFLWTFVEYTMHRFVFHYHPRSAGLKRLVFLFHGIHHAQPQCKTRLVMPPAVSIPAALIFYGLLNGIVGRWLGLAQWVYPILIGLLSGYLIYDLIHYATHHFPMRWGVLKYLKRYHMQHHYKTPGRRFGVSSPFWDLVFKTLPQD